jgi:dihydrofolate reductase
LLPTKERLSSSLDSPAAEDLGGTVNRLIAAIDIKGGIADDSGIPWQGRIPSDSKYFIEQTGTGVVVMGYRTYEELNSPIGKSPNFVAVRPASSPPLRAGFVAVVEPEQLSHQYKEDPIWVIGGAALFHQSMSFADELYITQLQGDFHCTKFFPEFTSDFHLANHQPPLTENGIQFQFQIWQRNSPVAGQQEPLSSQVTTD